MRLSSFLISNIEPILQQWENFARTILTDSKPLDSEGLRALIHASRSGEIVARLGGDEFGVIGVNCDKVGGEALRERVYQSLQLLGVSASIGLAMANASNNIRSAMTLADNEMYEQKRTKKIGEVASHIL